VTTGDPHPGPWEPVPQALPPDGPTDVTSPKTRSSKPPSTATAVPVTTMTQRRPRAGLGSVGSTWKITGNEAPRVVEERTTPSRCPQRPQYAADPGFGVPQDGQRREATPLGGPSGLF
jgi:hypothetical protein